MMFRKNDDEKQLTTFRASPFLSFFFFRWDWYVRIVVFCFDFIFGSVGGGSVTTQCMTVGSVGEEGNRTLLGQGNTRAGTKI